ncbi:glycosyltransferase family 4 protein [Puia sp.]|uniref:glycosyltransferase family 4 protein n=1 Tax=Puia sp. TaxID=2045100 RepID=UPI002F4147C3
MNELTILIPDITGGVYHNAMNLARLLQQAQYSSRLILTHQTDGEGGARITDLTGFDNQLFVFSIADNKYFLFKRLAALISAQSEILILNNWVDYYLVTHRRFRQKVIGIVHGDYSYYYDLARECEPRIDQFVCVSPVIAANLQRLLPQRKDDIVFIPAIVPDMPVQRQPDSGPHLRVIFVGRLTVEKGFNWLPEADRQLKEKGIHVRWTVVAPHSTGEYDEWLNSPDVRYIPYIRNQDIAEVYAGQDVILLPSHAEGFPLSLLEAIKCGVVPVATRLPTLVDSLVRDGESGFLFAKDDVDTMTEILRRLDSDRPLLEKMSGQAKGLAESRYSEKMLLENWLRVLARESSGKNFDAPVTSAYDRLDHPWLPNSIARIIRRVRKGAGKLGKKGS